MRATCMCIFIRRMGCMSTDRQRHWPISASNYVYDRGFVQYMTEQIQASNKLILVFVAVACTIFIAGMIISRRTTRRQLLGNHPHAKDEQEGVNLHDGG